MDIRNCKRCGNIFNYSGNSVCNHCAQQEQEDFDKVRDYLFEHPNSPASEINLQTGVELKAISRFLKEGRLKMEGADSLTCEKCGEVIQSGRFCEKCLQEMQAELKKVSRSSASSQGNFSSPSASIPANPGSIWGQAKVHTYDHILKKKD